MLTVQQIRAARALLDWRQRDLAEKSGISLPAITKLERRLVSPRRSTLEVLQKTFELEGVEFTEGPGVRLVDSLFTLQSFSGKEAIIKLFEDIIQTLTARGVHEVVVTGVDEAAWQEHTEEINQQLERYKHGGIVWRSLICEGDCNYHPAADLAKNYRWISKELFTQLPHYVYADKFAFVLPGRPTRVTIIKNRLVAETFRKQLSMNWKNGRIPMRA